MLIVSRLPLKDKSSLVYVSFSEGHEVVMLSRVYFLHKALFASELLQSVLCK